MIFGDYNIYNIIMGQKKKIMSNFFFFQHDIFLMKKVQLTQVFFVAATEKIQRVLH